MAQTNYLLSAGLICLSLLAVASCQEELMAVELAAGSPEAPSEILCPVKVHSYRCNHVMEQFLQEYKLHSSGNTLHRHAELHAALQDHGAVGDGDTYDTAAIQAAIDSCAQHPEGGVVTFEENGRYLSAQLIVKHGVRLRLPKTATLLAGLKVNAFNCAPSSDGQHAAAPVLTKSIRKPLSVSSVLCAHLQIAFMLPDACMGTQIVAAIMTCMCLLAEGGLPKEL